VVELGASEVRTANSGASIEDDASLALKSARPFSDRPNRVVDRFQQIMARAAKVRKRRPLERVFIPFLDGLADR